jgi:hypothetical protein
MQGKLALILCGGNSDAELFEVRDKIVDALNAVKTAINHVICVFILGFCDFKLNGNLKRVFYNKGLKNWKKNFNSF